VGKGDRYVGLTTLPPSCAHFREIWSLNLLEPSGSVQACTWNALPLHTYITYIRVYARTYIRCILTHNTYISEETAILRL